MDVEKIYRKSFLKIDENKKEEIIKKFKDVVANVDKIMDIDTSNEGIYEITTEVHSPMREDEIEPSLDREDALKNTSHRQYGYFKLEKVLED